jgi:hypothetical protein
VLIKLRLQSTIKKKKGKSTEFNPRANFMQFYEELNLKQSDNDLRAD